MPAKKTPAKELPVDIKHIDEIGQCLEYLAQKYDKGEISGIMFLCHNNDGTFEVAWSNLSYIERLGLLEAAKGDCHYAAFFPD